MSRPGEMTLIAYSPRGDGLADSWVTSAPYQRGGLSSVGVCSDSRKFGVPGPMAWARAGGMMPSARNPYRHHRQVVTSVDAEW